MNEVSVGLLGFGTVGTGVIHLLTAEHEQFFRQTGCNVKIEKVLVQNIEKDRKLHLDQTILTENIDDILENPQIDIVIEVMGGIEETRQHLHKAFQNKKHVVTANKDLMAQYGSELLEAAQKNHCDLYFEASVAGGIPIIRSITDGLSSDRIQKIIGIVNGTTNFILSNMSKSNVEYQTVLEEAQRLGFAESDPSSDVEGLDAARKMVILSQLAYSLPVTLDDVFVEGITEVAPEDIKFSKQLGYTIKLVGVAELDEDQIDIRVAPTLFPSDHALASVDNEYNAVYVYGKAVGETMFYGPGAGEQPTAMSVVSDIISVVKNMKLETSGQNILLPCKKIKRKAKEDIQSQYFFRMHVTDEPGSLSQISKLLQHENISLKHILQHPIPGENLAEVAVVTHTTPQVNFELAYEKLNGLEIVQDVKKYYRVEGEK